MFCGIPWKSGVKITKLSLQFLAKNLQFLKQFSGVFLVKRLPIKIPFVFCCKMSSEGEDDLSCSNDKLREILRNHPNKEAGVRKYLEKLTYPPVKDFTKGLEWFNVSESLSLQGNLKGKIVVLDFFTYCCINCMHILPDLKEIEEEFLVEDGVAVVGVHCAKFDNEKQSSNILSAVQRYNIEHPVVNDSNMQMWKSCKVHCWPTLVVLGPNAKPLLMLTGEGHKKELQLFLKHSLKYFKEKKLISVHSLPCKPASHLLGTVRSCLLFPGKITVFCKNPNHEIIAISDSGNHRIVLIKPDGTIQRIIGSGKQGLKDGSLLDAQFNNPQGIVFYDENTMFVADTDNNVIRKVDLKRNVVETIAGRKEKLSSPWDLILYNNQGDKPEVLIIAMAGDHKIWALFLEETIWWKNKKIDKGTCMAIAGSGREENRNNSYPNNASFAQPSGLALCTETEELFIADSESSSVRRLSLKDGKVTPVVGGDRNPFNLFAFGDKDGTLYEAKLQHSLGLTISDSNTLFVADTYNHKLKKIDISSNTIKTLQLPTSKDTTDSATITLNEPAGLCFAKNSKKLYLADTNNHLIKVLTLDSQENIQNLQVLPIKQRQREQTLRAKPLLIKPNQKKTINFKLNFKNGLKLTEGANQEWQVDLPKASWGCDVRGGNNVEGVCFEIHAPDEVTKDLTVEVGFSLVTCTKDNCYMKSFVVVVPLENGELAEEATLGLDVSPEEVVLQ